MFVGDGRAVAEGGMQPRRVVPAFDEAEAGDLRLGLRRKAAAFQQLAFDQEELPIPTRRTKRPICHSRAQRGSQNSIFSLVIPSAWIFDFYAHASEKWDVSDNPLGAGAVQVTPKLVRLRFSPRPPRVLNTIDTSARHGHGYDDPCRPSRKQPREKIALAIP